MTNPHRAAGLVELGPSAGRGSVVVVAVHGRDRDPDDVRSQLVDPIGDPSISWLLPVAADRCWYPRPFLSPREENQPGLDHALEVMGGLADRLSAAGVDPLRTLWVGFSQGACVVAEHLAARPRRWGGAALLTGGLVGPAGTTWELSGSFDGTPVHLGSCEEDPWIPTWRVQETAAAFRSAGALVTVEVAPPGEHEVRPAEVERVRELVAGVRS